MEIKTRIWCGRVKQKKCAQPNRWTLTKCEPNSSGSVKKGIIAGWQLDSMLAALRLSLAVLAVIDLAFHQLVRRYVQQLAIDSGVPRNLAVQLFPANLTYGIDIRYLATLLSPSEHEVIELYPGMFRNLAHEMAFTAAVMRQLCRQLEAYAVFFFGDQAYCLLRCEMGVTKAAAYYQGNKLCKDTRRYIQFCEGEQIGVPLSLTAA